MTLTTAFYRKLALSCLLLLIIWMPIWHIFLAEPTGRSPEFEWFLAAVWTLPLLLPLPGMLKGKPYTFAWANFIVMFYMIHGLTSVYAIENERAFAAIELVLCTGLFVGCIFYARLRGKELGLGIPKLKADMEQEKQRFDK